MHYDLVRTILIRQIIDYLYLGGIKLSELILVKPSKVLEEKILEYKQEYLDFEETSVNGSCGLAFCNDFDEWLEVVLSIEKDKLRKNVNASTFFSVRKSDNKIIGTIQLRHSLTDELEKHGGQIGYGIRPTERKKVMVSNNYYLF